MNIRRLKFDLTELGNEILDRIDPKYFESKTTTFIDPACAGGQFLKLIEDRLKQYGHSDANIAGRLFGIAENFLDIGFAKKTTGTVANISLGCVTEMNMDFDVALTNPPYQSANEGERNIGAPAWPVFIEKTMTKVKDGGVAAFVTPATWMNRAKQGAWKSISKHDLQFVNPNVKEHFPNVGGNGGTFCYFLLGPAQYSGETLLPNGNKIDFHNADLPRNNKYMNETGLEIVEKLISKTLDVDVKSGPINPSINSDHWSDVKTDTHVYETYYSGAADRRSIWCDEPVGDHGKWKLVVANSGNFYGTLEITKKGVGRQGNYILGESKKQLEQILELLLSDDSLTLCEVMIEGNYNNALKYIVG